MPPTGVGSRDLFCGCAGGTSLIRIVFRGLGKSPFAFINKSLL